MNKQNIHKFENPQELDKHLCAYISKLLKKCIKKNGYASLIVSGGSTPKGVLSLLSQEKISWEKVYITLADERWVAKDNVDSNEKMIRETLLQNEAKKAIFIGLKQKEKTAFLAQKSAHEALGDFPFPATVCLLGMGEDGHTASLFPNTKELAEIIYEKTLTCRSCTPLSAPYERMTLTPEVLGESEKLILHVVGEKKQEVLTEALEKGDVFSMPIRLFLSNPRMEVYTA